jgi:alpha-D-xyloside xylohydrolase
MRIILKSLAILVSGLICTNINADVIELQNGNAVEVSFLTPSTVRIVKSENKSIPDKQSLSVIKEPEQVKYSVSKTGENVKLSSKNLSVNVDTKNGTLTFNDPKGSILLKESAYSLKKRDSGADKGAYIVSTTFSLDNEEPIYGLGIMQDGKMNLRGISKQMIQGNTDDYMNIIQSIKGYGIFWDNYSPTNFKDNADGMSFTSEVGDCIDYYFMYGGNADGVISEIRTLTGDVPMLPLWSYGFMQSRERYKSSAELLEVLRTYRQQQIPIDCMIQDWQYWGSNYLWNAMEFNNPDFPNAQRMIDEVHNSNAHLMISIWSSFGPMTKPFRELKEKNLLFGFQTWPQSGLSDWPPRMDYPSGVLVYDAYSSEARNIYWNHLTRLNDMKIDGWWMDSTEPDRNEFKDSDMEAPTAMGSYRKVINAYPLMTVGGVYDHQRAVTSEKRVLILTRSAFAGQQRYGANTWSGDTRTSWQTLRNQIPAGLNFAMTGNPNYNSDLGGFFADNYNEGYVDGSATKNPLFQELYVRWIQYGVFSPMMRSHGTEVPREIYYYGKPGEPVYDALVKAVKLRYTLLPYIYSTAWQVTDNDGTFQRPLVMDFSKDSKVWDISTEFMFGSNLLIAPVVSSQYTTERATKWSRSGLTSVDFNATKDYNLYLPAGTKWYDFNSGKAYEGGQEISYPTTLNTIPLFLRAGSILPLGPDVQYSDEKAWDNLTIRIYPGANGSFTLYEDEGDNYNYEKGAYSTIGFIWNDKSNQLTIETRNGSFDGMLQSRNFNIELIRDGQPTVKKSIVYNGKTVKVKL